MAFLNTRPFALEDPLDLMAWDKFRIGNPWVKLAALREILRGDTPLMVGATGIDAFKATLWAVDDTAGRLQLNVQCGRSELRQAVTTPVLWAACYVDAVKVQFALREPAPQEQGTMQVLSARIPDDLYRMPRRRHVRVRRPSAVTPKVVITDGNAGARLVPGEPSTGLVLTVLDVSAGGCALHLPPEQPVPPEGSILRRVEVRLDDEHYLFTDLVVHTSQRSARGSHRVGCSWKGMPSGAVQTLDDWLRGGQHRHQRLTLQLE